MNPSGVSLWLGLALLLVAPVIMEMPIFTPPLGGCPCPNGLSVSTPFGLLGDIAGAAGIVLIASSTVIRRVEKQKQLSQARKVLEVEIIAASGAVIFFISLYLMQIDISGQGYQIYLYGPQGVYLEALSLGMLLFSMFWFFIRDTFSAIFLSMGLVIIGLSLFKLDVDYYEYTLHCSSDLGCTFGGSYYYFGDGLAIVLGVSLIALGIVFSLRRRPKTTVKVVSTPVGREQSH